MRVKGGFGQCGSRDVITQRAPTNFAILGPEAPEPFYPCFHALFDRLDVQDNLRGVEGSRANAKLAGQSADGRGGRGFSARMAARKDVAVSSLVGKLG